jgi:hypothetical protein
MERKNTFRFLPFSLKKNLRDLKFFTFLRFFYEVFRMAQTEPVNRTLEQWWGIGLPESETNDTQCGELSIAAIGTWGFLSMIAMPFTWYYLGTSWPFDKLAVVLALEAVGPITCIAKAFFTRSK